MYAYITLLGSGLGDGALMAHLVPPPNQTSCMKMIIASTLQIGGVLLWMIPHIPIFTKSC